MKTQSELILDHLKSGKPLTSLDALIKFGCFRLGARIFDLKQDGHNIGTDMITKGKKTFASYFLHLEGQTKMF